MSSPLSGWLGVNAGQTDGGGWGALLYAEAVDGGAARAYYAAVAEDYGRRLEIVSYRLGEDYFAVLAVYEIHISGAVAEEDIHLAFLVGERHH